MNASDEDGVLDLRALANVPVGPVPYMPVCGAFAGPVAASDPSDDAVVPVTPRLRMVGVIAGVVAVVVLVGAAFALRPLLRHTDSGSVARTTFAVPAPTAMPAAPAADVPATPGPTVDVPVTRDRTADALRVAPAHGTKSAKQPKRKSATSPRAASPTTSSTGAAPRSADPCGCHRNLDCALRCAANK